MGPIRKYNLSVNLQKDKDKKGYWKNIGEIAVWSKDDGTERLQTTLYMYPDLNIGTFLDTPRDQQPVDIMDIPTPQGEELEDIKF